MKNGRRFHKRLMKSRWMYAVSKLMLRATAKSIIHTFIMNQSSSSVEVNLSRYHWVPQGPYHLLNLSRARQSSSYCPQSIPVITPLRWKPYPLCVETTSCLTLRLLLMHPLECMFCHICTLIKQSYYSISPQIHAEIQCGLQYGMSWIIILYNTGMCW